MKYYTLLIIFCLSCFVVTGEALSEDTQEKLQISVKMGRINSDAIRGEDRKKIEVIKFYTYQDEDDEFNFQMRVTAEITDKNKNTYSVQLVREQGEVDTEYTGEDNWELHIPHGDLEWPKLTAYSIQYGILHEDVFISLAEKFDDVDSADEIKEHSPVLLEEKMTAKHSYSYRESGDEEGEVLQSPWE